MKRHFMLLCFFTMAVVISCRKNELFNSEVKIKSETEFFNHSNSTKPEIIRLINELKTLNSKTEFVTKFTESAGKPKWEKGYYLPNRNLTNRNSTPNSSDSTFIVPVVAQTDNFVTGAIIASVGDSTTFRLVRLIDYQNFDTSKKKFVLNMLNLDYQVYGFTKFSIVDTNILNNGKEVFLKQNTLSNGRTTNVKDPCDLFEVMWDPDGDADPCDCSGNEVATGQYFYRDEDACLNSNSPLPVISFIQFEILGGSGGTSNYYTIPNLNGLTGSPTGGGGSPLPYTPIPLTEQQKKDFLITELSLNPAQIFYLENTNYAVEIIYDFLTISTAINKNYVATYALNYLISNPGISFDIITSWFFTNPNPDTQEIQLLNFVPFVFDPTIFNDPDINFGGIFDNLTTSTGPGITDETKEHVLKGNIKGGKAGGFHFFKNNNKTARVKPGSTQKKVGPPELGMFKSKVQIKTTDPNNPWLDKVQESTFFPPTWDEQKVLNAIQSAFDTKVKDDTDPTKNRWTGTYTDPTTNITIQIQLFLKPNNEIITAFPKY